MRSPSPQVHERSNDVEGHGMDEGASCRRLWDRRERRGSVAVRDMYEANAHCLYGCDLAPRVVDAPDAAHNVRRARADAAPAESERRRMERCAPCSLFCVTLWSSR